MDKQTGPFRRVDRLLRGEEFRRVGGCGRRVRTRGFVLLVTAQEGRGDDRRPRLGLVVGRRVGKAVVRNRVKRRIREWFRAERALLRTNLDIVVVAQRDAAELSQCESATALREGARAAGVLA